MHRCTGLQALVHMAVDLICVEGIDHRVVEGVQTIDEAELDPLALLDQPRQRHSVLLVQASEPASGGRRN